ncbi:MAG: aminoacyl-tRNA hydrolase [Bdellovibrio sp.]|nr:aminoacyl-tRNA hydrolase [Bdellovibrio sp.]
MKLIVGLGNPGPQYETSRHNVGFLAIDRLIDAWHASGPINKAHGLVYQAEHQLEKVLLVKPQTFMNLSGKCVGALFQFYQCKAEDLVVIHDDLDLDPFVLRLKTGGGTGGHNGLKSIDASIGKENIDYHRIRIGIGHPARLSENETRRRTHSPSDHVLGLFDDLELKELDSVLDEVVYATEEIVKGQIKSAMNKLHRKKQE